MASTPSLIGQKNINIPSQEVSSKNSLVASNPDYFDITNGGYASTSGYAGFDYDLIQTTTVNPGSITYTFTNEIYKSYMRKLDINFVAANVRPNRRVYPYFDGVSVSNLIQRPNIIEITGNSVFFGVVTPYYRNAVNVDANGNITGPVDHTREQIKVGDAVADVLFTELSANGNTRVYVGEFRNFSPNSRVITGNTITGVSSGKSEQIISVSHYSGKLSFVPTVPNTFDPNTFVNSNSILLSSNGYVAVAEVDPDTSYGLQLGPDASQIENFYVGNTITVFNGTVPGETSNIISYNAATRVISVKPKLTGIASKSSELLYSIGEGRSESFYSNTGNTQAHFTTDKGFISGILHLPGYGVQDTYNFNVGKRLFRITDDVNNNEVNSTTIAEYIFASYSIEEAQTIRAGNNVIISTSSAARSSVLPYKGKSPLAQSFFIDDVKYPRGIFVPYIDVFFARKGTQPIEMQIRPMVNGYPDSYRILKNATVTLQPENINIVEFNANTLPDSVNSNHYTRFTFPGPVYLQPGTEYSFLLVTNDFDYSVYASELGSKILGTNRIISEQPYLGSLFKSQNSTTYEAVQSDDLMFVIHKCVFDHQGTVSFNELKDNTLAPLTGKDANLKMDMFSVMSDAIQIPGTSLNYYYQGTSFANSALDPDFTEIIPDTRVFLEDKKYIMHESFPSKSFILKVDFTTENSDVSPILFPERLEVSTAANYISNMGLNGAVVKILNGGNNYTFQNTSIAFSSNAGGGANAYVVTGGLSIDGTQDFSKVIADFTYDSYGSDYFDDISATITSSDANTTNANAAVFIVETELDPQGGPALTRYISKTVTLAPEFDAGDLRIYLTASKPPEANVQVYYKVKNSYDTEDIDSKRWTRMERKVGVIKDSLGLNPIELEYRPSLSTNNVIYSTDTATYDTFNQFKIKIVLSSSSTSFFKIPYVYDMRAIALPGDVR